MFSRSDFREGQSNGFIRTQKHPELDLWIHNYTNAAQYTKSSWKNPAVKICRGLISDHKDEVVAQPFPKFFNHGEPEAGELRFLTGAKVLDKLDGSLGILYPTGQIGYTSGLRMPEYAVATRGSFSSEQAIHATQVWREKYAPYWTPDPKFTYLFEIIYPENRIVLDYGDMDDLVLLGAHHTGTPSFIYWVGASCSGGEWWPGPVAKRLPYNNLQEALEAPPRENAEGVVAVLPNKMIKIKQEDYILLHRLVTGLRPRSIWEFLAVNACKQHIEKPKHWGSRLGLDPARAKEILDLGPDWQYHYLENVPDEMHQWVTENVTLITRNAQDLYSDLKVVAEAHKHLERKEYFLEIQEHEHRGILGLMYDRRDVTTAIWKAVYPSAEGQPFKTQDEGVA